MCTPLTCYLWQPTSVLLHSNKQCKWPLAYEFGDIFALSTCNSTSMIFYFCLCVCVRRFTSCIHRLCHVVWIAESHRQVSSIWKSIAKKMRCSKGDLGLSVCQSICTLSHACAHTYTQNLTWATLCVLVFCHSGAVFSLQTVTTRQASKSSVTTVKVAASYSSHTHIQKHNPLYMRLSARVGMIVRCGFTCLSCVPTSKCAMWPLCMCAYARVCTHKPRPSPQHPPGSEEK